MEAKTTRGFKEISVSICGVQPPTKLDDSHPSVASWRNNLTALSQVWNLYFVAHQAHIYVYQPQYPTQRLSSKPALILNLPVSRPSLRGYIDDHNYPHAINNLLVADLGEQEVLACVCDDGDVVVYHIRTIFHAVRRRSKSTFDDKEDFQDIRAFFVDNVGLSAWGLAIHTASRMLAVSSNTGDITVFAFALANELNDATPDSLQNHLYESTPDSAYSDSNESSSDSSYEGAYLSAPTSSLHQTMEPSPPSRSKNKRITLSGNRTNVPNISFCNTDEDPDGRWLASTDIGGFLLVWDIWARRPVSIWRFGDQLQDFPSRGDVLETRGWGVLCLDPRSFRSAQGAPEIFGCIPKRDEMCWCNTDSRLRVRDSTIWHGKNAISTTTNIQNPVSANEDDSTSDPSLNPLLKARLPHMAVRGLHQSMLISEYYEKSQVPWPQAPWPTDLRAPFGLLHTSAGSIRLIEHTDKGPSLICRSPLVQVKIDQIHHGYERLNMLSQAPELGLVFVATQSGRVAILSLTQGRTLKAQEMAFRIEAFLPLRSQEEQGLRPNTPLLGFAIGPVQTRAMESAAENHNLANGHRSKYGGRGETTNKIRLMMTYRDRTVMSYEVSRTDSASHKTDHDLLVL
ncbi:MAG: hypothetical protein M1812_007049 [Candelaria pacifica]|nr:MAG: hypothetical protein M1812_007049 [Candelaria pacifica]